MVIGRGEVSQKREREREWRDKTSAWVLRSLSDRSARSTTAHTVRFSPALLYGQ